jgi:hypothetical protein
VRRTTSAIMMVAFALTALSTLIVAAPASAAELLTCNGRLPIQQISGLPVPGNNSWRQAGGIMPGQTFRVVPTSGQPNAVWYGGSWPFQVGWYGPAGRTNDPAPSDGRWLAPGAAKYSLVGSTITNSGFISTFPVSTDSGCRTYNGPPPGPRTNFITLWLAPNDDDVWDNSGQYTATVLIY